MRTALLATMAVLGMVVTTACTTPGGGPASAEAELLALNAAYDAALLAGDAAALERIYGQDFNYIGPGAVVRNRQEQIDAFASGAIDLLEGGSDDVVVRRYGDTAVLTGRFQGRARVEQQEFAFLERYLSVWVRQDGQWQLVFEHGTVVPESEPAH